MKDPKSNLLYSITEVRTLHNLTLKEVAGLIGIPTREYTKKEKGKEEFTFSELVKVSEILDIKIVINPTAQFSEENGKMFIKRQSRMNAKNTLDEQQWKD